MVPQLFFPILIFICLKPLQIQGGFKIDLIHRNSKLSPFYNESATLRELSVNDALRSISRSKHIHHKISKNGVGSRVIPNGGDYLMKLSLGSPPMELLAVADTGSDLVWVQCEVCMICPRKEEAIFNSSNSKTYKSLSCESKYCVDLPDHGKCDTLGCLYSYKYGDGSYTKGLLSSDTVTLSSKDDKPVSFTSLVFGCGYDNGFDFSGGGSGVVGLGGGPLSLISQMGSQIQHKFSYCLVLGTGDAASPLTFGESAIQSGQKVVSTRMSFDSKRTFYYMTLVDISVGKKRIAVNKKGENNWNTIIDSGTTLTMLESSVYEQLENAVKGIVDSETVEAPAGYKLCYDKISFNRVAEISVALNFKGARLELKPLNIFRNIDYSIYCLAFAPSPGHLNIFGNVAQINFLVEYDLAKKKIYFSPTDCLALD